MIPVQFHVTNESYADAHKLIGLILERGVKETLALLNSKIKPEKAPSPSTRLVQFIGQNCFCGDCARMFESDLRDPWYYNPGATHLTHARNPAKSITLCCDSLKNAFITSTGRVFGCVLPQGIHKAHVNTKVDECSAQQATVKRELIRLRGTEQAARATMNIAAATEIVNSGQAADTIISPIASSNTTSGRIGRQTYSQTTTHVERASDRTLERNHVTFDQFAIGQPNNNQLALQGPETGTVRVTELNQSEVIELDTADRVTEMRATVSAIWHRGTQQIPARKYRKMFSDLTGQGLRKPVDIVAAWIIDCEDCNFQGIQSQTQGFIRMNGSLEKLLILERANASKTVFKWLRHKFYDEDVRQIIVNVNAAFP